MTESHSRKTRVILEGAKLRQKYSTFNCRVNFFVSLFSLNSHNKNNFWGIRNKARVQGKKMKILIPLPSVPEVPFSFSLPQSQWVHQLPLVEGLILLRRFQLPVKPVKNYSLKCFWISPASPQDLDHLQFPCPQTLSNHYPLHLSRHLFEEIFHHFC